MKVTLATLRSYGRIVRERLANQLTARRFDTEAAANGPVPDRAVALFFAVGPENAYQFDQWRRPLEALAARRPVVVIVDRPDTGRLVLARSSLPVAFARASGALERLVEQHRIAAVLYANQVEQNFRMLRFAEPVHVQIGHGESDKGGSVSNQHKAYDYTFIGGPAGRERLARALYDFDAAERIREVGRPQLDYGYPGAPDWPSDGRLRVLYAPTWEGDRASIRYGSLVSHGAAIIDALRADPRVRIIYRPHPRVGKASAAHGAADQAIRDALRRDGDRHLVDLGPYGWQWRFADHCITDVSAVAYDWLATGKPLVITEPAAEAYRPPSALLDALPLLPATEAGDLARLLPGRSLELAALAARYFGETADGASTRRFEAALDEVIARRQEQIAARPS